MFGLTRLRPACNGVPAFTPSALPYPSPERRHFRSTASLLVRIRKQLGAVAPYFRAIVPIPRQPSRATPRWSERPEERVVKWSPGFRVPLHTELACPVDDLARQANEISRVLIYDSRTFRALSRPADSPQLCPDGWYEREWRSECASDCPESRWTPASGSSMDPGRSVDQDDTAGSADASISLRQANASSGPRVRLREASRRGWSVPF